MSTPPVEREVRQLDTDVQSIYEMLAGIQGTQRRHGNRLEEIDAHVGDLDGRLTGMDGRLESVESRLGDIDGKLDRILGLLDR